MYDFVGVGFGPAGIALAAAISDLGESRGTDFTGRVAFFERSGGPGWQTGLLFRNADIQHHYMRDLATPRDPRSRYTFANFLKQQNRIFEFGSLVYGGGGGAVSRIEWSHYVAWVAGQLDHLVTYDCPVETVHPARFNGGEVLLVKTAHGEFLTRALAFCAGQDLNYPQVFQEHVGDDVFHGTQFLNRMKTRRTDEELRVCVVGAGQAAIEIVQYLHGNFPRATIDCVQRSIGFHHGNHSPFVQRMFHPAESDDFFKLKPDRRRALLQEIRRANYASVDREAVSALYRAIYEDTLLERPRIRMITGSEVTAVRRHLDGALRIEVCSHHDETREVMSCDVAILATGFVDRALPTLLEPLRKELLTDHLGDPEVAHDFSLVTGEGGPIVYVPGAGERSHGLGSSNSFSMIALKAERVVSSLVANGLLSKDRKVKLSA